MWKMKILFWSTNLSRRWTWTAKYREYKLMGNRTYIWLWHEFVLCPLISSYNIGGQETKQHFPNHIDRLIIITITTWRKRLFELRALNKEPDTSKLKLCNVHINILSSAVRFLMHFCRRPPSVWRQVETLKLSTSRKIPCLEFLAIVRDGGRQNTVTGIFLRPDMSSWKYFRCHHLFLVLCVPPSLSVHYLVVRSDKTFVMFVGKMNSLSNPQLF